ncbi:ferrochelatase [Fontimonas sp. SYSU GA230001]|uniref:ferrochelatase n=1 Tax=Fontimonas sp. SYSU GA230001 TaxID=3142450 RepID=UPI0032B46683
MNAITAPSRIDTAPPPATGTGVLLVNLGTPSAPTAPAIRRYLREFLADRRVVDLPRLLWWPILYGFILPLRPRRLAHAYGAIWTERGSPLLAIGRDQQQGLQQRLGHRATVALAMRYGEPSVTTALAGLQAQGVTRLLVLPLYPQYSATTTASVLDAVFDACRPLRAVPELRTVNDYHDDAGYIAALADSVRHHWATHGRGDHLLLSFHSIPQRYEDAGDPYGRHCRQTAQRLAQLLDLPADRWSLSFQSRVGRAQWLSPYTDEYVTALAGRGVRRLDVICPGFAADCLETLEEVALRYAADFRRAGGEVLRYIPALNAEPAHLDALAALVERHLAGWPCGDPTGDF